MTQPLVSFAIADYQSNAADLYQSGRAVGYSLADTGSGPGRLGRSHGGITSPG